MKNRHAFLFWLLFSLLLVYSCQSVEEAESASSLSAFIDGVAEEPIAAGQVAGMTIAVARNGEMLHQKGYGLVDLEWEVPTPVDASYEIGSVTKQFTAVAVLQLAGQGKLSLQDDLTEYFPDYNFQGHTITVEQLFDHTSGIKGYTELPEFWEISMREYSRDTLLEITEQAGFDFAPGEALIYNNTAYFMLGLIIEQVSDTTYAAYLEENIFSPLGMDDTYYCDEREVVKKHAHGYSPGPEGALRIKDYLDHTWPYAAGSLCSTAGDLVKWNQALHGGKILSPEMYEMLITPGSLNDGTPIRYAKGLANYMEEGHRVIQHGGGINGFLSDSRYYPDADLVIVTLINTTAPPGPADISRKIAREILEKTEEELPVFEGDLSVYAGTYKGRSRGRDLVADVTADENRLIIQPEGAEKPDTLEYLGDNTWREVQDPPGNEQLQFTVNDSGAVTGLMIDQVYGVYVLERK